MCSANPKLLYGYQRLLCCVILESFTWLDRPHNPTVVVEGPASEGGNSSRVSLIWRFNPSLPDYDVSITRQKPDQLQSIQIAGRAVRGSSDSAFNYPDQSLKAKYEALIPATLVLKDVKRNEEFIYTLTVTSGGLRQLFHQVTINVVGE